MLFYSHFLINYSLWPKVCISAATYEQQVTR
ncbi:hypothetical protein KPNJ1_01246 [Klebsiella pneumoniae 30660/NJST258_1]|uniref:Uncharacterized protein n=1 Tax=Klebsiella pneumoniae 30684/NJST258_2 TaxID=1420013 RepID=W8UVU6_KLEPN|nr:hypothetical protein KP13_31870 [Klebsiella pneumoniae subsp. pneumoniae Kp13]AHM78052.1 hypothetical protein KPNJ2_01272 [Klebsiella pneumoniae 30684/NJST258_2]AHM83652.1 hypothetical protein KPNJ1_01246 [Klebsiella pneumoniae 30660/NJST258_1]